MSRWHVQVQHPRITRQALTRGDGSGVVPDVLAKAIFEAQAAPAEDLTAIPISTGTPAVGSPAITQTHGLTAAVLAAGTPTLGEPTLSQAGGAVNLAAQNINAGTPTLGAPAIVHVLVITAQGITTGTPALGAPAATQKHALVSTGATTGTPTLGAPTAGQKHAFLAQGITAVAPALGNPALLTAYGLVAVSMVAGIPTLEEPAVNQYPPGEWVSEKFWGDVIIKTIYTAPHQIKTTEKQASLVTTSYQAATSGLTKTAQRSEIL
jgi:hypothetical protein